LSGGAQNATRGYLSHIIENGASARKLSHFRKEAADSQFLWGGRKAEVKKGKGWRTSFGESREEEKVVSRSRPIKEMGLSGIRFVSAKWIEARGRGRLLVGEKGSS